MVAIEAYLVVSALIFAAGVLTVLLRRGAIVILMGIELMLNAANLAFVAFARHHGTPDGQIAVFFVIALFRIRETTDVDEVNLLRW